MNMAPFNRPFSNSCKISPFSPEAVITKHRPEKNLSSNGTKCVSTLFHGKLEFACETHQSSGLQYSLGLWLTPSFVGVNIILVGQRRFV
jgi:hypothetical protein